MVGENQIQMINGGLNKSERTISHIPLTNSILTPVFRFFTKKICRQHCINVIDY